MTHWAPWARLYLPISLAVGWTFWHLAFPLCKSKNGKFHFISRSNYNKFTKMTISNWFDTIRFDVVPQIEIVRDIWRRIWVYFWSIQSSTMQKKNETHSLNSKSLRFRINTHENVNLKNRYDFFLFSWIKFYFGFLLFLFLFFFCFCVVFSVFWYLFALRENQINPFHRLATRFPGARLFIKMIKIGQGFAESKQIKVTTEFHQHKFVVDLTIL